MILAIDPGPQESGFVLYDNKNSTVKKFGKVLNRELEDMIIDELQNVPTYIEFPQAQGCLASNALLLTCRWAGRYEAHSNLVELINRKDVVNFFECHKRTRQEKSEGIKQVAFDTQIRHKIIEMFGGSKEVAIGVKKSPGPLYGVKADVWQALAIALMVAKD